MTTHCEVVRGGIHCARTAKVKAGIYVPPHSPTEYHYFCAEHYDLMLRRVELLGDPSLMVEVVDL